MQLLTVQIIGHLNDILGDDDMFYFIMFSILLLILFALGCVLITTICKNTFKESFIFDKMNNLKIYSHLHPMWPTDENFASLKFSMFRHLFIAIVFAALIFFLDKRWLNTVLLTLAFAYMFPSTSMIIHRHNDLKEAKEEQEFVLSFLRPVMNCCRISYYYKCLCLVYLYMIYAFRP